MAPTLFTTFRRAVSAAASSNLPRNNEHSLLARGSHNPTNDPDSGVLDPHNINNAGFFALFAIIGVGIVCTGIWFFFWAKNGGFRFKENDWDDYKTTVLRRRGPNGTLLSGATESTDLGGGSVYKDVDDDGTTVITESTALSGITAGASDIGAREKRRRKQEERERKREKAGKSKTKRHVGEEGVLDEDAEKAAKKLLRTYRHEKPARVGGLNKESEGSNWDGSTNPSNSTVDSELLSNRQSTPTSTPTKSKSKSRSRSKHQDPDDATTTTTTTTAPSKAHTAGGGIRKVYSVADRRAEAERLRAEARRLREEGRTRRDFAYQRAESYNRVESSVTGSGVTEGLLEGSDITEASSDLGTKSYHHPMPELKELERERRNQEREERRARRGGYRRGKGEDY
jgi:hypothetical protein